MFFLKIFVFFKMYCLKEKYNVSLLRYYMILFALGVYHIELPIRSVSSRGTFALVKHVVDDHP